MLVGPAITCMVDGAGDQHHSHPGCEPPSPFPIFAERRANLPPFDLPQTKSEKYLIENFSSKDVVLNDGDLQELREIVKTHAPKGGRQTVAASKMYDNN